ncbi:MAG: L,D-transpeptidase [bacterium]|nr:L,D-transpeptidase [bacterium]
MTTKRYIYFALSLLIFTASACGPLSSDSNPAVSTQSEAPPSIKASPVSAGEDNYKIVTGDEFKLTVIAPNAAEVQLFYQPATEVDRALKLKTLGGTGTNGEFVTDVKIPADFNGEVWAQVKYQNGENKETEHLLLARREAMENAVNTGHAPKPNSNSKSDSNSDTQKVADTDESARSDKLTKGQIKRSALKPGDGDVRITVNVPAFTMTLWQGDREIKSYYVGVGKKNFPIPVGMRSASKIILNPDWIPPDSEWVRKSSGVEPYERISADDPQNPLGKIKIPLGDAYLLHEAQSPSDIGNLVSHGCVRVLRDDLFEITKLIAEARNIQITGREIDAAKNNSERRVINLNGEIPVDINYDSMVVENGTLALYPDVYDRNTNTIESLRAELESYGVDLSKLDSSALSEMLGEVNSDKKFVVELADIRSGTALTTGKAEPLIPQQAAGGTKGTNKKTS